MRTQVNWMVLAVGFAFLLVLGGFGAWYTLSGPCGMTKISSALVTLRQQKAKFDDADKIASSAARIELAIPVQNLQTIRSETEAVEVPECLLEARQYLLYGMEDTVNAYLHVLADDPQADMEQDSTWAANSFDMYTDAVGYMMECAPFCPTGE